MIIEWCRRLEVELLRWHVCDRCTRDNVWVRGVGDTTRCYRSWPAVVNCWVLLEGRLNGSASNIHAGRSSGGCATCRWARSHVFCPLLRCSVFWGLYRGLSCRRRRLYDRFLWRDKVFWRVFRVKVEAKPVTHPADPFFVTKWLLDRLRCLLDFLCETDRLTFRISRSSGHRIRFSLALCDDLGVQFEIRSPSTLR